MYYKNHTHRKKVGNSSEFPFGIYWSTLKNPKSQKKILLEISYQFTHVYQKPQSGSLWDTEWHNFFRHNFFCHLGPLFAIYLLPPTPPPPPPPPPNTPENQNFEKKKKASGDVIILNLCNKKQSNDVCILRYGVWQT